VRVVLAGTEAVFVNLGVEELAGKLEGIIKGAALFDGFAEGFVGVIFDDGGGGIYYLPDTAEPVVKVEVSAGGVVAIVLGDYLAVGVNIGFLDRAGCRINLHQDYRQISHDINDILASMLKSIFQVSNISK